jgi:hypothetical protein
VIGWKKGGYLPIKMAHRLEKDVMSDDELTETTMDMQKI